MDALLVLEDGSVYSGRCFGARGERTGEVVFTTSMTGYQEILTDPSYCSQIVVMTVPHVGNVGVNSDDLESHRAWLSGFVVRDALEQPSNWRSTGDLSSWLAEQGVVGIAEVDTRALVRHIREHGAMRGVISSLGTDVESLRDKACSSPRMEGLDLVREVSCDKVHAWTGGRLTRLPWEQGSNGTSALPSRRVVAYDFGAKQNILRHLAGLGLEVIRVPATTSARETMELQPDGVFLSNGPGDPAAVDYAVAAVGELVGKLPVFGICLGHQILALALGGRTYKLKFGHRGANCPVRRVATAKVEITTQNHGFAVDAESLPQELEVTHLNLNDGTVEGVRHSNLAAFSVQYHPEASPGPHDSHYLFKEFRRLIDGQANRH